MAVSPWGILRFRAHYIYGMPRRARCILPGLAYHVTQRGADRQRVFFTAADRRTYLRLIGENLDDCAVRLWAYCLMTNHIHLVVVPVRAGMVREAAEYRWSSARAHLDGCGWEGTAGWGGVAESGRRAEGEGCAVITKTANWPRGRSGLPLWTNLRKCHRRPSPSTHRDRRTLRALIGNGAD